MRKLFASLFLSLAMIMVLAACASEEASPVPPAAPPSPVAPPSPTYTPAPQATVDNDVPRTPQTIVMWHSMSGDNGIMFESLVREFNDTIGAELSITVDSVFQGTYAESMAQLRPLLNTNNVGALPDISQIDAGGMMDIKASPHLARAQYLLSFDPGYDISQIHQVMLNNLTYQGQLLGMPFASSVVVLYYNRDMFREAGIAAPPSTLAEMAAIIPSLTQHNADGSVAVYGFAHSPATPTVQNWIGQQNTISFTVDQNNGRSGDPTRAVFDENGTMAVLLTEWQNLFATGGLRHIEGNTNEEFVAGNVAMKIASSAGIAPRLRAIDNRFELGIGFFPRVNEDASYGANIGGAGLFVFDKNDHDRAMAAWEVLKFMASAEVQARWGASTGYLPVNISSADYDVYIQNLENQPQFMVPYQQLLVTNPDLQGIWVPASFQVFTELRNGIIAMLEDGESVESAVSRLANNTNQILTDWHDANR